MMVSNNYSNSSTYHPQSNSLMNKIEIKIIFGIIMVSLCLITTIGNLIVIYKYKRTYSVCLTGFISIQLKVNF